MSLQSIQLRKILKILYSEPNRRISALRSDIRTDISREAGDAGGGGDFYGPFWKDAKDHVFGLSDLHASVDGRITNNVNRRNLYPRLRDGFLTWWNERRRWTNEPFRQGGQVKGSFTFPSLGAVVKIDNVLSVQDGNGETHFVYPYFSPEPILQDEAARLGLWLLQQGLPDVPSAELRILDVIRGQTFSIDRFPLTGNEEQIFLRRYQAAIEEWNALRREYD